MRVLLTLALFFIHFSAHAYYTLNTNIGANFAQDSVRINVADHTCDNIGRTPSDLLHLAQIAVDQYWNTVATSRLELISGDLQTLSLSFKTDPICSSTTSSGGCNINPDLMVSSDITIACNNNTTTFPDGNLLGMTVPNNIQGEHIVGALFLLNDTAATALAGKTDSELITIIAHELGHAIGIGHCSNSSALMYYQFNKGQKMLGTDDIEAVSYLYAINQPDILGCNSVKLSDTPNPASMNWILGFLPFFLLSRLIKRRS